MNRREILTLCGLFPALPLSALAQSSDQQVIGFLNGGSAEPYAPMVAAFLSGLKEAGVPEGRDAVVYRWADGDYARLPELAADLIARQVDVIAATGGDVSALAAQSATRTIPIVFNIGGDPVQLGLVASLSRPGGNITGVVQFTFELATKRLEILRDLAPGADTVAALLNPTRPNAQGRLREVQDAARAYGKRLVVLNAAADRDLDAAFTTLVREQAGALLVGSDPFFFSRRQRLVELAARYAVPAIYDWRDYPAIGGLASYGTSLAEAYRQVGLYVGRVLKGEKPSDLPVLQSVKFELVLNLKTARVLDLKIPPVLLAQADEVID
jgi:putative tryptophan/tyrosine transport system substrate-binding protein